MRTAGVEAAVPIAAAAHTVGVAVAAPVAAAAHTVSAAQVVGVKHIAVHAVAVDGFEHAEAAADNVAAAAVQPAQASRSA